MIGKGFAWYIILELLFYASATNVAMALPLSILLSTIMTYGSLGENYELVAIKSAGISLSRAMYPMLIMVSVLSAGAFLFSNYMLPVANRKYLSLLYDVQQQRSATLLKEGVFSYSFPGHVIRIERKDPNGQTVYGIIIYESDRLNNNIIVTRARQGRMYRSKGDRFLVLELEDGIRYEETPGEDAGSSNNRQQFKRFRFKSTTQKFDLSGFNFNRTNENEFKSLQMMDLRQLNDYQKNTRHEIDSVNDANYLMVKSYVRYFSLQQKPAQAAYAAVALGASSLNERLMAATNAVSEARGVRDMLKNNAQMSAGFTQGIRRSSVEYQKKFTLSVVCIVLFLIGAPLGAIIRRGGLGLPVVVSVAFFLIYYIISNIGETSVKDGDMPIILGMWIAIIVLTPVGVFLSYKAATDSALFDNDYYKRLFNKLRRRKQPAKLPAVHN